MILVIISIAISIVVGTSILFLLLRKIQISNQIDRFRVVLACGLPVFAICLISKTVFFIPIIVTSGIVLLLFYVFEVLLRQAVAKSLVAIMPAWTMSQNGAGREFEEANTAAGEYPYEYMTESFYSTMTLYNMQNKVIEKQCVSLMSSEEQVKFWLNKVDTNPDFKSDNYSVVNGCRVTTDVPKSVTAKVLCFGGSTTFCEEVPDQLTYASVLQRLINNVGKFTTVVNHGRGGASVPDRLKLLYSRVAFSKGDTIVFLFGDNDCGWIVKGKRVHLVQPLPLRVSRLLAKFGLESANWFYGEFAPRYLSRVAKMTAKETMGLFDELNERCDAAGAHLICILQPNLFTLRTKSDYESELLTRFSGDIQTLILESYKEYERIVTLAPYGVSGTHVFNDAPASVFLDWAHVNARGNEIIAEFIFEELKKRELISDPSSV